MNIVRIDLRVSTDKQDLQRQERFIENVQVAGDASGPI
jgi:hypothetical protein